MKTVTNILRIQPSDYIELVFETYVTWCELYAIDADEFQKMLVNESLYAWFMRSYRNLENVFIKEVQKVGAGTFSTDELNTIYDHMTIEIGAYYPKSILYKIRKQQKTTSKYNLN